MEPDSQDLTVRQLAGLPPLPPRWAPPDPAMHPPGDLRHDFGPDGTSLTCGRCGTHFLDAGLLCGGGGPR